MFYIDLTGINFNSLYPSDQSGGAVVVWLNDTKMASVTSIYIHQIKQVIHHDTKFFKGRGFIYPDVKMDGERAFFKDVAHCSMEYIELTFESGRKERVEQGNWRMRW